MKILHIGKFYPPFHGGMENYLCDLAEVQAKKGHEVTVLIHNHDWSWLKSKTEVTSHKGVQIIRQASLKPLLFAPIMLGLGKQLKQIFCDEKPDVMHLHCPNPSLFFLLMQPPVKQIPWVLSWHSDMVTENSSWLLRLIYRFIKPLETKLIKYSDLILVSSQNYADYSPQLIKNESKTKVLPLGIDTDKIKRLSVKSAQNRWDDNKFRLFHLGRLTFYKNQAMLVEAMPELTDAQLLIAGAGQLGPQLQKQIEDTGQNNIKLLGSQTWQEVHELYAGCEVFCMASNDRAESFGVVLIEAMYHDKVILVPDTVGSGMQWLAENYNKGFIYEADNRGDFVAKIKYIKTNYTNIVQRSGDFDYSIDQIAQHVQMYYQNILSGVLR